ncbi:MAG TPA: prepilin-type N-terminal cleavage/methylation domain-containing protein [Rheinheimera sp.]|uniref:PilW family protein n=1 Tax=Rheinheimera sp. TaxID=1869214 RepID=UPI002F924F16
MRCRGFTLVELVITLVVLAILALGVTSYLGIGSRMYADAALREQVLGQSRFVAERLVRELRNAVPNSINNRFMPTALRDCLKFRPILFSGIYTKLPHTESSTTMEVISPSLTDKAEGKLLIVYPTKPADFALSGSGTGKATVINKVDFDSNPIKLEFSNFQFSHESPEQRFYIADDEVEYCAISIGKNVKIERNGVLMADGLTKWKVFDISQPVLTRNAVVHILLRFGYEDNADMFLNYEVHIPNVP